MKSFNSLANRFLISYQDGKELSSARSLAPSLAYIEQVSDPGGHGLHDHLRAFAFEEGNILKLPSPSVMGAQNSPVILTTGFTGAIHFDFVDALAASIQRFQIRFTV